MPEAPGITAAQAPRLSASCRAALLWVARASVDHGLHEGSAWEPELAGFEPPLRAPGASFVTLRVEGRLRGCTGALDPTRPLVIDVAHNAYTAAFRDPRFAPLGGEERAGLALHVSVLSAREPLEFGSEAELLAQLEPHVHGLVIEADGRRATFLPAVWAQLSDPRAFLRELKSKAGLDSEHETRLLRASRYTVLSISDAK